MEQQQPNDKVLARIRKMINLANDTGATEGERDAAMHQVYNTLAKYNLSMSDVETKATEDDRGEISNETHGAPWVRSVCNAVATLFFCKYYYVKTRKGTRHIFLGRKSNVITAQEMAMYVFRSIERESLNRYRSDAVQRLGFAKGATARIYTRCEALRAEAERALQPQGVPGTALVLASLYRTEAEANDAWLAQHNVNLKAGKDRQKHSVDWNAYGAGQQYGDSVSLNKQMGSSGVKAGLLR